MTVFFGLEKRRDDKKQNLSISRRFSQTLADGEARIILPSSAKIRAVCRTSLSK
ncbi:hypothetical protein NIASO_15740 [Niabella soli DSM 19437]|uniref:Uncharacterized protein n=1 Tax=Niabella soli DSM 19437 TaxID=929713 RepID=W0F8S3_9BACT|nr:hypothetical protein NIASO_15740 [Niabella soli DSM 19437]